MSLDNENPTQPQASDLVASTPEILEAPDVVLTTATTGEAPATASEPSGVAVTVEPSADNLQGLNPTIPTNQLATPVKAPAPEVPVAPEAEASLSAPEMMEFTDSPTVQQDYDIEKKGTRRIDGEMDRTIEAMAFPSATPEMMEVNLRHPAAKDMTTGKAEVWTGILQQGETPRLKKTELAGVGDRENSSWRQGLDTANGRLTYSSPKFAEKEGVKLVGENALIRMRALLGGGGLVQVPLWHSGFHITLKTPKDSAILELRERNEQARISLGRVTFGTVFSNTSGYLVENVLDMILDHVYSVTLKDSKNLREKISVLDLPILIWGMACCIWPNGFQYARSSVTADGVGKKEIITALVDVAKLMWVDQNSFTDRQKAHMSNRQPDQITEDMRKIYLEQFVSTAGRTITLKEDRITVGLKVPMLSEYIASTHVWIDSLVSIIDRTFSGDRSDIEGRNRSILEHANLSRMRQYGHWIANITIDGQAYDDREMLDSMLEVLSGIKDVQEIFYKGTDKFIADSTVACIAIPETSGKETSLPRFPHLIPIDALGVFFSLLIHRISRMLPTEE